MKKNILIVSGVFPPEPLTSSYMNYDLATALSVDYNVTVLRPKPTRPLGADYSSEVLDYDKPFRCITLESYTHPQASFIGRTRESVSFARACVKYINKHSEEINFIYNSSWQMFGYYIVARAAVRHKIPYIVPIQDIFPECVLQTGENNIFKSILSGILLQIDKYYQKHAYKVRTISDEMADYLSRTRKIPYNNYLVVNNWQDDEAYENIVSKESDKLIFAFVGSINKTSRVEYIIKSFIKAGISNSELRIYGNGVDKAECEEYVRKSGVTNIMFDSVPRSEVPRIQAECDVLLSALEKGTAGLCLPSKLTSYMLSGKAIIVSVDDDSATARYISEAGCGYVVEPDNEIALSQAFSRMASEGKMKIKEYGKNAKLFSRSHLSKKTNLGMVVNTIKEVI